MVMLPYNKSVLYGTVTIYSTYHITMLVYILCIEYIIILCIKLRMDIFTMYDII